MAKKKGATKVKPKSEMDKRAGQRTQAVTKHARKLVDKGVTSKTVDRLSEASARKTGRPGSLTAGARLTAEVKRKEQGKSKGTHGSATATTKKKPVKRKMATKNKVGSKSAPRTGVNSAAKKAAKRSAVKSAVGKAGVVGGAVVAAASVAKAVAGTKKRKAANKKTAHTSKKVFGSTPKKVTHQKLKRSK